MANESQIINRLNALMKAGYKIDEKPSQASEALWLVHPATKRAKEPVLILYSDGLLVSGCIGNEEKQLRLVDTDTNGFNEFIYSVPVPNIFEKSSPYIINILVWSVFLIIFIGILFITNILFS